MHSDLKPILHPWRGPGPGRPELPLPPGAMPLVRGGVLRKRWTYVGAFGERLMLCAGVAQVGPFRQSFWAVWDRERRELYERTRRRRRGQRAEVTIEDGLVRIDAREVQGELRFGDGQPVEVVCPSGAQYAWTRKRADLPVDGALGIGGRSVAVEARGVIDESAGYHQRRTAWRWTAGVGRSADGRSLGWNLVAGINDPPRGSERAVWIDGLAAEVEPVRFEGLEAVAFADGSRLECAAEAERARRDNLLLIRSEYRQPFGSFRGSLPGGVELESGWGVMEEHRVVW